MANIEQLAILHQGVEVWNKWRKENIDNKIDLSDDALKKGDPKRVDLTGADLNQINLMEANLSNADLRKASLQQANLWYANLAETDLGDGDLSQAHLVGSDLTQAHLDRANLQGSDLTGADLSDADLTGANLQGSNLNGTVFRATALGKSDFTSAAAGGTIFGGVDLSTTKGLDNVEHWDPSDISTSTFMLSKGKISEAFLRGCGLSDWEIEEVKLYNPELTNDERNKILYRIYDLQASQAIQISPLFISYSQTDSNFVDNLEAQFNAKGVRFWRDIHNMKAGRLEKQIDRALRQNPTVLLVLSEHSLSSDWVEHEVRTARDLGKELERDTLCPIALDDSWKSSRWPKRVMEQIMEYNILDFSAWKDDSKFDSMFRKLIDGLELFYKG